jgi:hypothetical protein
VLSLGQDDRVCFWNARTGKREHIVEGWPSAQRRGVENRMLDRRIFSPDARSLAIPRKSALEIWDVDYKQLRGTLHLYQVGDPVDYLAVSPDGYYRGPAWVERRLVHVAVTPGGQETLTPKELTNRYGWENDPDRARLTRK